MTEVRLTNYTPDPKGTVWRAARVCYSSEFPEEVPATQNEIDSLIRRLLTAGHMSPFEHASFTFDIEDVSRVTTHQIVRHRIASYSQKSQRYAKIDPNYPLDVVQPPSITPELEPIFDDVRGDILVAYRKLIRGGGSAGRRQVHPSRRHDVGYGHDDERPGAEAFLRTSVLQAGAMGDSGNRNGNAASCSGCRPIVV